MSQTGSTVGRTDSPTPPCHEVVIPQELVEPMPTSPLPPHRFEEEKKESSEDVTATAVADDGQETPFAVTPDSSYTASPAVSALRDPAVVATLWKGVTWYPVVGTSTGTTPRRWMAVQGDVRWTTRDDTASSRPLFRHPAAWTGEPFRTAPWTPLVSRVRQALLDDDDDTTPCWNHVTLECWQWPDDEDDDDEDVAPRPRRARRRRKKKKRSVTAVHERIDPSLDLEPHSPIVRVFLSGPLCADEDDTRRPQSEETASSDTPSPEERERLGTLYLRPKRYDRQQQRRTSPRTQHAVPIHSHNVVFTTGWETNQTMTYEISLRHPPLTANNHVIMLLTFRHVSTLLVERERLPPLVVQQRLGRPATENITDPPQVDAATEWKRLSQAFFEEKRQEGAEQVYGPAGSFLVPHAKTKPCLSPHNTRNDHDDVLSVSTPTSLAAQSALSTSPGQKGSHRSRPLPSIDVLDASSSHHPDDLRDDLSTGMDSSLADAPPHSAVALLVVDLQNDFLGDDPSFSFCRLTHRVSPLAGSRRTRLLARIDALAAQVRDQKGVVVFCRSVYGRWSRSLASSRSSDDLVSQTAAAASKTSLASGETGKEGDTLDDGAESITSSLATVRAGTHVNKDSCCSVGTKGSDFYPDAAKLIQEDDVVITKQWYSAFLETSLHLLLQRLGVQTVVVCGVTTNHSVSATVRSAAHLGYSVIVSSDGTAQIDPSLQPETEAKLQTYASILAPKMSLKELLVTAPVTPRSLGNGRDRLDFDGWNRLSAVGSGDSFLLPDLFDPTDADEMLRKMRPQKDEESSEIDWKYHSEMGGRGPLLTAYQCGRNERGDMPVCRMAMHRDQQVSDWSASIAQARSELEVQAGHPFNFVRLVHHKTSNDSVRLRSDMCLDMKEGTSIAIVALGEGLVLELRPKPGLGSSATAQKVYLRHNTLFLLGPETNRLFQYSIRCSGKAPKNRHRISLTFRELVTFRASEEQVLYGPGTRYSTLQDYRRQMRLRWMWEGAGMVACGASSLTLLHSRIKTADSIGLAAAPVVGMMVVYKYMFDRRRARLRDDESRLEQTFVRCNWQPLRFTEAQELFLNATDNELFGNKAGHRTSSP